MEYIEFGKNKDVVWVVETPTADMSVKALTARGYAAVTRNTPLKGSSEAQSVWEENRYLDAPWAEDGITANRPETVYMLFRRTEKNGPEMPVLASTSSAVADKATDALTFMFPNWEIDIRSVAQPE